MNNFHLRYFRLEIKALVAHHVAVQVVADVRDHVPHRLALVGIKRGDSLVPSKGQRQVEDVTQPAQRIVWVSLSTKGRVLAGITAGFIMEKDFFTRVLVCRNVRVSER